VQRTNLLIVILVFVVVLGSCLLTMRPVALAQDLTPQAAPPTGPVLLLGGTVFPVSSPPIENGAVLIERGAITSVGPASSFDRADRSGDTTIIDTTGKHIYPGLIATTSQIGLIETSAVRATRDENETGAFTPEVRAAVAVNPDSTLIPVTRMGGVLLTGVTPRGGRVAGMASSMRLTGWTWDDMTIDDDAALVVRWPRVRPVQRWYVIDTPQDQWRDIEENLGEIDAFFDAAESYAAKRAAAEEAGEHERIDVDIRLEAMRPFVAGPANTRKPMFIGANDVDQIVDAVTWANERSYNAVIIGGRDAELCAELLRSYQVPVVLNGVHRFPKRADSSYAEAFNQPARLAELGVRFAINSSDRTGNVRNLPHEAALARRHGLSESATLRAITLTPAEVLGVDDRYGSLDAGKSATIIVADGDIFEVTTSVEHAWIDGKRIPMESKQTELRDKYRAKYRELGLLDGDDEPGDDADPSTEDR
jgi:imidazolonepropionase-like amidohydrolase